MRCAVLLTLLVGGMPTVATAAEADEDAHVRDAVERGLKFLASQQKKSGAWELKSRGESPAVTSLAVMAFLSAGHVPGEGPYGKNLDRAIDWVLDQQTAVTKEKRKETVIFSGQFAHAPMYSHGICTTMLAEVVVLLPKVRSNRVRKTVEKSVRLILAAQNIKKGARHIGGWRYSHTSRDSDLTVTSWQETALRAARIAGFNVPKTAFEQAAAYIKKTYHLRIAGFGYQPFGAPTTTRNGVGIFALELCGERKAPESIAAAKYIENRPINIRLRYAFYGCYHCTAGMFKLGGATWKRHREFVFDLLLVTQDKGGSWAKVTRARYGPSFDVALALLALTLERGHLPIYRR